MNIGYRFLVGLLLKITYCGGTELEQYFDLPVELEPFKINFQQEHSLPSAQPQRFEPWQHEQFIWNSRTSLPSSPSFQINNFFQNFPQSSSDSLPQQETLSRDTTRVYQHANKENQFLGNGEQTGNLETHNSAGDSHLQEWLNCFLENSPPIRGAPFPSESEYSCDSLWSHGHQSNDFARYTHWLSNDPNYLERYIHSQGLGDFERYIHSQGVGDFERYFHTRELDQSQHKEAQSGSERNPHLNGHIVFNQHLSPSVSSEAEYIGTSSYTASRDILQSSDWPKLGFDAEAFKLDNPSDEWEKEAKGVLQAMILSRDGKMVQSERNPLRLRDYQLHETERKTFPRSDFKRRIFLREKINYFISHGEEIWFQFLFEKTHFNFQNYRDQIEDDECREIFPVYLFLVHLLDEIIPREVATPGETEYASAMHSASKLFIKLEKSDSFNSVPSETEILNPWIKIKLDLLHRRRKSDRKNVTIWIFLGFWLQSSRKPLYDELGNHSSCIDKRFKVFTHQHLTLEHPSSWHSLYQISSKKFILLDQTRRFGAPISGHVWISLQINESKSHQFRALNYLKNSSHWMKSLQATFSRCSINYPDSIL